MDLLLLEYKKRLTIERLYQGKYHTAPLELQSRLSLAGCLVNAKGQNDTSDVSFVLFDLTTSNLKYSFPECRLCITLMMGLLLFFAYLEFPECIVLFHASLTVHTMFLLPRTLLALFSYWLTPTHWSKPSSMILPLGRLPQVHLHLLTLNLRTTLSLSIHSVVIKRLNASMVPGPRYVPCTLLYCHLIKTGGIICLFHQASHTFRNPYWAFSDCWARLHRSFKQQLTI